VQGFVAPGHTRVTFDPMAQVDPQTLRIIPDAEAAQQPVPEEEGRRPTIVGALIAGYGCFINPGEIVKIEPVAAGTSHFVMAHLRGQNMNGEASQRSTAFLTPPLDTEEEAQRMCDRICGSMFMVLSTNPATGGAHWPAPVPGVEERFGL